MIIFSNFEKTRPIAVLLSSNGKIDKKIKYSIKIGLINEEKKYMTQQFKVLIVEGRKMDLLRSSSQMANSHARGNLVSSQETKVFFRIKTHMKV